MWKRWAAVGVSVCGIGCSGAPYAMATAADPLEGGAEGDAGGFVVEPDGALRPRGDAGTLAPDGGAATSDGQAAKDGLACVPHCAPGVTCGVADDGCGGQMQCGTCSGHETCGGGGKAGQCGCTPAACVAGQTCGAAVPDNCGGTEDCGACGATAMCEKSSCLPVPTSGCQQVAPDATTPCTGNLGPGEVCVIVQLNGGPASTWQCTSPSWLPRDLCRLLSGFPNKWQCCALPGPGCGS